MNKQPEITEATRAAFVTAFCQLSLAHPHEKITVQQISDRAGYNRTTFYRYFCDTIAVRDYLEDTLITGVITTLRGARRRGTVRRRLFRAVSGAVPHAPGRAGRPAQRRKPHTFER